MKKVDFKAWDTKRKMFTNFMIADNMFKFMDKVTGVWFRDDEQKRFKLLQNTGLKDKNGKEIYEGDIVRGFANDYTPIYQNGIYMAYNVDKINDPHISTQFNVVWRNGCEVIGNIYENADLLEVENDF